MSNYKYRFSACENYSPAFCKDKSCISCDFKKVSTAYHSKEDILNAVISEFSITERELKSKIRKKEYVIARQMFAYLCKEHLNMNAEEIAKELSKSRSDSYSLISASRGFLHLNDMIFSRHLQSIKSNLQFI